MLNHDQSHLVLHRAGRLTRQTESGVLVSHSGMKPALATRLKSFLSLKTIRLTSRQTHGSSGKSTWELSSLLRQASLSTPSTSDWNLIPSILQIFNLHGTLTQQTTSASVCRGHRTLWICGSKCAVKWTSAVPGSMGTSKQTIRLTANGSATCHYNTRTTTIYCQSMTTILSGLIGHALRQVTNSSTIQGTLTAEMTLLRVTWLEATVHFD